jgi:hypothetical protein
MRPTRLTPLVVPVIAAALLITSLAGPASAAARPMAALLHVQAQVASGSVRAAASASYHVVLDAWSCHLDGSTRTVVGDVYNYTSLPVRDIEVTVTLRDDAGRVRGSASGGPWIDVLDPGEGASFRIDMPNARGATRCAAGVTDWAFADTPANNYFTSANVDFAHEPGTFVTRVFGTLANDNTVPAADVIVVATLYDADGGVVGASTGSFSEPMTPGDARAFSIDVEHRWTGIPVYWRIQAESTSDPQTATTMHADPTELTYGGSTVVDGTGVPGDLVHVQRYDQPTALWIDVPSEDARADASGAYSFTLTPVGATMYRVTSGSVTSVPVVLFVHARVTLKASAKKVGLGQRVVLSGVARPLESGQKVAIQRKVGASWKTIATVRVSPSGSFSYAWRPSARCTYVLRARVGGNAYVLSGTSSSVTIVVR